MQAKSFTMLAVIALAGRAHAQSDPADICRNILSDAGRNINISSDSSAVLDTIFDKYCNASGTTKSSSFDLGLGVVIGDIPANFTLGSSNKQTAADNFCRNYSQVHSSSHQNSSFQSNVVDKALDTMEDCVQIARSGSFLTHKILNDEKADIYLTAKSGDKVTIQGVSITGNVTCQTNVESNNAPFSRGKAITLDENSRFEFDGNLTISCIRKKDAATSHLNETNASDGNSSAGTDAAVFSEATISVSTKNIGPYAFLWPRAARLAENEATQINADIKSLKDTVTSTNTDLAAARAEIVVLQGRNVFGNRACTPYKVTTVGWDGLLICPAGQYAAGVIRYKTDYAVQGVICCPGS